MIEQPAVFLDRDGVICTEKGYVTQISELEIFPYTKHCIELLHQKGFLVICITNQSAVARGLMTEEALLEINEYLLKRTFIDDIYYCPHHPGMTGKYGIACSCRKPGTGMLEKAIEKYKINRTGSYMVGDRASDILCGQKAGLKTVLVESRYSMSPSEEIVDPDFKFRDLKDFTEIICNGHF